MKLCSYGCGKEANYPPGKGRLKWCCNKSPNSCSENRRKNRETHIGKNNHMFGILKENHHMFGKKQSKESIEKNRETQKGRTWEIIYGEERAKSLRKERSIEQKLTIEQIKERYLLFSKIEEMRYNPDKPGENEIQVHCKNHLCKNSKEQEGWFTPIGHQLYERIRHLEKEWGNEGCYLYCSQECKDICPLYQSRGTDPFRKTDLPYIPEEYQTFRNHVLTRDNYLCQFCGEKATDVHHERPQKLESFFALDPDFAWSCCEECHYSKGHTGECNTGNLAKKNCQRPVT